MSENVNFKIGDKVVYIRSDEYLDQFSRNEWYEVKDVQSYNVLLQDDSGDVFWWDDEDFELYQTPKQKSLQDVGMPLDEFVDHLIKVMEDVASTYKDFEQAYKVLGGYLGGVKKGLEIPHD